MDGNRTLFPQCAGTRRCRQGVPPPGPQPRPLGLSGCIGTGHGPLSPIGEADRVPGRSPRSVRRAQRLRLSLQGQLSAVWVPMNGI